MNRKLLLLPLSTVFFLAACAPAPELVVTDYPETRRIDHVDDYHGTEVADPYRWLEDDVRESEDVEAWVDSQNEVTFAYLQSLPGGTTSVSDSRRSGTSKSTRRLSRPEVATISARTMDCRISSLSTP